MTSSLRASLRVLVVALALSGGLAGCAIDEQDLRNWQGVAQGDRRLAAYMADDARPLERRVRAARHLLELGALSQIMGVVHDARPADRKPLLDALAELLLPRFEDEDAGTQARAKDLAYYLLEYTEEMAPPQVEALAVALADWCVRRLTVDPPPPGVRLDDALQAAALARPEAVRPRLVNWLETSEDPVVVVRLARLLMPLQDAKVQRHVAEALLSQARRTYPALPQALVVAMGENGNETLLRFLLDAARDPRVPLASRDTAIEVAVNKLQRKALPGLLRLLASEDPLNQNVGRWVALDRLWELGGVERLREILRGLPTDGTWPDVGDAFKAEVDRFCDVRVSRQKAAALPILTGLLDDPNWVARVFAAECIVRLFPDDAARILEPLQKDPTPLRGWVPDQQTTLGEVVRRLKKG